MVKSTFVFLRHGESEANLGGYFQGQTDTDLTARGITQAKKLANRWKKEDFHFDLIISSPLKRARQTAEIISNELSVSLEIDADWQERDTGKLTGMDRQQAINSPYYRTTFTPFDRMGENGEGDFDLFLRAGRALRRLLERPSGSYLVVSHGGILNQALRFIMGVTPQPTSQGVTFRLLNCSFASLTYDPESYKWNILAINDGYHLKEGGVDTSLLEV